MRPHQFVFILALHNNAVSTSVDFVVQERKMAAKERQGQKDEHTKSDYLIQTGVSRKRS